MINRYEHPEVIWEKLYEYFVQSEMAEIVVFQWIFKVIELLRKDLETFLELFENPEGMVELEKFQFKLIG